LRRLWGAAAEHLREQQAIPALLAADQMDFEGGALVWRQETAEIVLGEPPLVQSYVIHPLTSVHMGCLRILVSDGMSAHPRFPWDACASSFQMGRMGILGVRCGQKGRPGR
jgi:hypothetical protein